MRLKISRAVALFAIAPVCAGVCSGVWTGTAVATQYFAVDYAEPSIAERPFTVHDVAIALSEQGFVAWDSIRWKKGYWVVDDARGVDGDESDLRVDPDSLAVVWSSRD